MKKTGGELSSNGLFMVAEKSKSLEEDKESMKKLKVLVGLYHTYLQGMPAQLNSLFVKGERFNALVKQMEALSFHSHGMTF